MSDKSNEVKKEESKTKILGANGMAIANEKNINCPFLGANLVPTQQGIGTALCQCMKNLCVFYANEKEKCKIEIIVDAKLKSVSE